MKSSNTEIPFELLIVELSRRAIQYGEVNPAEQIILLEPVMSTANKKELDFSIFTIRENH